MAKRTCDQLISNEDDSGIPALKKRREEATKLPKIFDGTYFTVVDHDKETKSISAKCMNCIKEKIVRGQSSSTGNFYQHFLRTHAEEHIKMKEYCDERTNKNLAKRANSSKTQTILPFSTDLLDQQKVIPLIFFSV